MENRGRWAVSLSLLLVSLIVATSGEAAQVNPTGCELAWGTVGGIVGGILGTLTLGATVPWSRVSESGNEISQFMTVGFVLLGGYTLGAPVGAALGVTLAGTRLGEKGSTIGAFLGATVGEVLSWTITYMLADVQDFLYQQFDTFLPISGWSEFFLIFPIPLGASIGATVGFNWPLSNH